ncbi:hypothetical protein N7520_001727 [Penicillium odoratum]|uniref:uncharacterized protein n=1 Tax=Penicillium odoratum TaxID=1167516 RepID=UPI00254993F3|nr:uncharacterized protein N7520_001727 [Penicillium odoratum]KAJ5778481.1 hypothetical protein N7520_001727 [Penicillium odoratum]
MQIKNVIFTTSFATVTAHPDAKSDPFSVIAIHSGSSVQNSAFDAAHGGIFAGLPSQNASCDNTEEQYATFYLSEEALYLYSESDSKQEIYVDASEIGKIGYTTGTEALPRNGERAGWANNDGHLQFAGNDLIACPNSIDGAWSIWASAGVDNPAGNTECVGIVSRIESSSSKGCTYTS